MPLGDGATFAGFGVVRLLGSGGMGEVYLVQHPRLPRLQALRILPGALSADDEFRARFNREADLAASLSHPHIVGVHDRGECDGRLWISMGYVEGIDAAQLLREHYPQGMPRAEALQIVEAIAKALDHAADHGLLHRNVKPANILLSNQDTAHRRILLADLGIARRINDISGLTATNVGYTAPEQLLDSPDIPVDGRADQYSLAATAYHLLTGAAPFADSSAAVIISRHLESPPPKIGDARPELGDLDAALSRALAKDPAERFTRCQDFSVALGGDEQTRPEQRPALAAPSPQAPPIAPGSTLTPYGPPWPPPGPPPPGWGPPLRRRTGRRWALGGAALVVVAVALVVALMLGGTRSIAGHPVAAPSPTGGGTSAASANDTGPVGLVTEDPTCPAWVAIGTMWLMTAPVENWDAGHPGQQNPLMVPGNTWTPEQRKAMQATASATRIAAVKTAALARTTPHRVVREIYEQFIAYGRAFADSIGDSYVPRNALGATAESALNVLQSICVTVESGAAAARSALVTAPSAPQRVAPPQDPTKPERFLTTSDIPACGQLVSVLQRFKHDPAVQAWDKSNHAVPAGLWNPQQKALNDAVAPLMTNLADDIERIIAPSGNPVMTDFGTLSAQYQRAFVKALPTYTGRDGEIDGVAGYTRFMLADACQSVGT